MKLKFEQEMEGIEKKNCKHNLPKSQEQMKKIYKLKPMDIENI